MAEPNISELLSAALKSTQELRASVGHVFQQLGEGLKDVNETTGTDGKEKVFLSDLQQRLLAVEKYFRYHLSSQALEI